MRIEDVQAFAVVVPGGGVHAGGAGVTGDRTTERYSRVTPYRPLFPRHAETVFVRVRTDDGGEGWGECQAPVGGTAVARLVEEVVTPVIVGRDPLEPSVLERAMYDAMRDRGHGGGFMLDAIAGVDIALWDLRGKHYGEPVARILGGAFRERVPLYLSGPRGDSVEERLEDATAFVEQGFGAVKLFVGRGVEADLAEVRLFRERFGDGVAILVDAHWQYPRADALRLGRGLEEFGVRWLEAPIDPEDVAGHAALVAALDVPIALGETERTRFQVKPFLEQRAVDVLQPDVGRCGVGEAVRIAELAEVFNVPVAIHCGVGFGPYIAASLQVAAAVPSLLYLEYQPDMHDLAGSVYGAEFHVEQGGLVISEAAGLGIGGPPESLLG